MGFWRLLTLPFALFLVPVGFLLVVLYTSYDTRLTTARNEVSGLPGLKAALDASRAHAKAAGRERIYVRSGTVPAVQRLRASVDNWLGDAKVSSDLGDALAGLDANPEAAQSHLEQIIRLLADASELILDPELDSYHLVDGLVNISPVVHATAARVRRLSNDKLLGDGAERVGAPGLDPVQLEALLSRLSGSLSKTQRYLRSPALGQDLNAAATDYMLAVGNLAQLVDLHGGDRILGSEPGIRSALNAADAMLGAEQRWSDAAVELLGVLLKKRISEVENARNAQILMAIFFLIAGVLTVAAVLRYFVLKPLDRLASTMTALADGKLDVAVADRDNPSRIGAMAEAVAIFRTNAVCKAALEQSNAEANAETRQLANTLERAEMVAQLGHWSKNRHDRLMWSPHLYSVLGFDPMAGPPGLTRLASAVLPQDRAAFVQMIKALRNGSLPGTRTLRIQHEMLGLRYVEVITAIEKEPSGKLAGAMGVVRDVTEVHLSALHLQARTEALAEAQEIGRIGDWSYEFGKTHVEWSQEIYALLGYQTTFETTREAVIQIYQGDGAKRVLESQTEALRSGLAKSVDVVAMKGNGTLADFTVTSRVDRNEAGEVIGFRGTIQDISERKRAERELEQLAFYDPLTGLANRALFQRALERELERFGERKGTGALLLLDLDGFKEVNDSLGHAAGDEVLVRVAAVLKRELPTDAFLARLGGDEFATILVDCDTALAKEIGDRIVARLAEPLNLRQGEVSIGTSVGVAMMPQDGHRPELLLRHADLALYDAKDSGRACVRFFRPSMSALVQEKMLLARDLRHALSRNDQLYVVFQPQVNILEGRVSGFEALLRWRHPSRGEISPADFIPIAESSNLINDIGLHVLKLSCEQLREWNEAGLPRRHVSVNVSAAQIWHLDFEHEVRRIVENCGIPPELLTLEVTEGVFLREAEGRVRQALQALKSLGVKLALDDFGTGYSSLGYLNRLPFDELKIDRSFVKGVDQDPEKLNLLKGIVELSLGLGMKTVAEGAESIEEVRILRALKCDTVQGYVFARPCRAEAAARIAMLLDQMVPATTQPERKAA